MPVHWMTGYRGGEVMISAASGFAAILSEELCLL
jgi:hypothetical protein